MAHNHITNEYISLGDKSHIVIVNLEWNYEGIKLDNELYSIIKYLKEEEVTSEFTKMIDKDEEIASITELDIEIIKNLEH